MFGMCDTSRQPSLGYMEIVQSRDAATLLPIITAHIQPGIKIKLLKIVAVCRVRYSDLV